jgi:hypothetical protein
VISHRDDPETEHAELGQLAAAWTDLGRARLLDR